MSSKAYGLLQQNLSDVEEIIKAHENLTGGGKGKPAGGQGAALTRAGVVLLSAAMESFVEELFKEAAGILYSKMSPEKQKTLFKQTAGRLNNADELKTNLLYFNLGCPWVLSKIRWPKFSNEAFIKSLKSLIESRGYIAHGDGQISN
jgi:hypothetical protein